MYWINNNNNNLPGFALDLRPVDTVSMTSSIESSVEFDLSLFKALSASKTGKLSNSVSDDDFLVIMSSWSPSSSTPVVGVAIIGN